MERDGGGRAVRGGSRGLELRNQNKVKRRATMKNNKYPILWGGIGKEKPGFGKQAASVELKERRVLKRS